MNNLSEHIVDIGLKYLKLLIYNIIGLVIFSCGAISFNFAQYISEIMKININYHNNKQLFIKGSLYIITSIFLLITTLSYAQFLIINNDYALFALVPMIILCYCTSSFMIFYIPVTIAYDLSFLDQVKMILILPLTMPLMYIMLLVFNLSILYAVYLFPYLLIFGIYMVNVFINTVIFNAFFIQKLKHTRKEITNHEI
ncbi:MAG: hypothetical protein ACRCTA_06635 [Bacilli bacterium]